MKIEISKIGFRSFLSFLGYSFGTLLFAISASEGAEGIIPFFMGCYALGGGMHYNVRKLINIRDEVKILQLIKENDGQVTIADLMIELKCSVNKAKKILAMLQKEGVISTDVNATGELIYTLSGNYLVQ
ncbi:hypothetical protein R9C00_11325 [Flammeovirgaceae bacterium SG7u.111]|nr:hypothetical protein [Flammeovirgaceae bacterium SG7u.132]WPO38042.1 hypothetical protein R9C00_11325 [Flammeovirgaceae bacterium SG7u.111]